MIKLILTDMDGTFLNSQGSFDKELYIQVKKMLNVQGIEFAPCTGKQCERVEELFGPELSKDLWILGDSATRIKHNGEFVYQSLLPNKIGLSIIEKLEKIAENQTIIACTSTAAVIKSSVSEDEEKIVRGSYQVVKSVDNLKEITDDFVKITVFDAHKRCFETVKELDEFKDQAYLVASEAAWIDISNYNVHKGTTVNKLQEILGVSYEETMAFGDGLNDIELLACADYSFAMRNGFEETKKVANFITQSNDENGVLNTIKKIISLQEKSTY
ncbi:hypothetical protein IGI37_002119 [Enterococcus sp. AZ194]|uniref:HAD-IIB family hydrolase n=1 Tax=Enterococcus sp. AZ194 TaxID=2774629 RepID=UPI003F275223